MKHLVFGLSLLALSGCPKPVPAHLQVTPQTDAELAETFDDLPSLMRFMIGADPLARSPKLPDEIKTKRIPKTLAVRDWLATIKQLERAEGDPARNLQQVEDTHSQTVAVALARGYRMHLGENTLAKLNDTSESRGNKLLELWSPLAPAQQGSSLTRPPLEWLGTDKPAELRAWAERWVLLGWLDSPDIPLEPVAEALVGRMYDGLQQTPAGRIILTRTGRLPSTTGDEGGTAMLRKATDLALERAASDRDNEQDAFSLLLATAREEEGTQDPIGSLLMKGKNKLIAGSQDDQIAGLALIALAAERWRDTCEVKPCGGMDRVDSFQRAQIWGDQATEEGSIWRVISLKESIDSMDVGHDTVMFPAAADQLTDALLGTGGGPLSNDLLRRRRPDPATWLAFARGAGAEGVTEWKAAREALGGHLAREVDEALKVVTDERRVALLNRIKKRALP